MPVWLSWVLVIATLLTLVMTWTIIGQLAFLRQIVANPGGVPRSRQELEKMYTKGTIGRDAYERFRNQLK